MNVQTETVVTLTPETSKKLERLATLRNKDFNELLNQLVDRAVSDACYRIKRNQEAWAQKKALAEHQADLIQRAKDAGLDVSMFEEGV